MLYILSPFLIIREAIDILTTFKSYNAVKKNIPMTGKKNGAYSLEIKIADVKGVAKIKNCTINDYVMGVYSNTLYQYFDSKKHEWNNNIPR
jgi:hypothetical protein